MPTQAVGDLVRRRQQPRRVQGRQEPRRRLEVRPWLTRPEVQVKWYQAVSDLPAVQASWEDPTLSGDALPDGLRRAAQGRQGAAGDPDLGAGRRGRSTPRWRRLAKTGADPPTRPRPCRQKADVDRHRSLTMTASGRRPAAPAGRRATDPARRAPNAGAGRSPAGLRRAVHRAVRGVHGAAGAGLAGDELHRPALHRPAQPARGELRRRSTTTSGCSATSSSCRSAAEHGVFVVRRRAADHGARRWPPRARSTPA